MFSIYGQGTSRLWSMNGNIRFICIDLDRYGSKKQFEKLVSKSEERCRKFGIITHSKPTKNGHHIKIRLKKKVRFWRSIEIREYCLDDLRRMYFDIMRHRLGADIVDVCFDRKIKRYN